MTLGKNPDIMSGIDSEFVGHGLVFGKFMPPTNGHLHFIQFARQSCRKLTIMVCSTPEEPIAGEVRYKWMKELFPDCNVVYHYADIQQEPVTSPEDPTGANDTAFFESWRNSIYKHCPGEKFDALFASEEYGFRVADSMGIKFIPVDIRRDLVPISGTAMRNNPMLHWDHLHPVVRPYFAKRIAVMGPEHCGKSEVTEQLAGHFHTSYVGDYFTSFLNECERQMPGYSQNNFSIKDVSTIARGQMASEASLARQANRLLFCDTELKTVEFWSRRFFNDCPTWVAKAANDAQYDLYLLMDPKDAPAIYGHDAESDAAELQAQFDWLKASIEKTGKPVVVISGKTAEERFRNAVVATYQHIPEIISAQTPQGQFRLSAGELNPRLNGQH
jgi:HTH-type transcriptional repressor of NAD biosynthesis genes